MEDKTILKAVSLMVEEDVTLPDLMSKIVQVGNIGFRG